MKKLLSMIGAMVLIGTASTSVIACGGKNSTPTAPNDISTKITSPIFLGQLFENTKADFLVKLQDKLKTMSDLITITPSDYDVYKAGTTTAIQDSDITTGNSLNIKIVAKGNKFKGTKDNITVNYTKKDTKIDISTKITSPIFLGQLFENTKADFLVKLQDKLKTMSDLITITPSDYDVYKAGTTTAIQDSDITTGNSLNIKIVAKGNKFKGTKDNITVNYIISKNNLFDLNIPINTSFAELEINNNSLIKKYDDFKNKLIEKLKQDIRTRNKCKDLATNDIDIFDESGKIKIQDSDIKNGDLRIRIVANFNSKKYEGEKITIVTLKII